MLSRNNSKRYVVVGRPK